MTKKIDKFLDDDLKKKKDIFIKNINSEMHFKSEIGSDFMSFEWLDEIEIAIPYIDNIVRNPKVTLISEEDVVKIEKAKKISASSVKDLSVNTRYIEDINENNEVRPSKILITRNEETFNIYENRFIYTLIDVMTRFILKKEKMLDDFEMESDKVLEYAGSTGTSSEKVNIELKISSKQIVGHENLKSFQKEIDRTRLRIKKIKEFIIGWRRSELIRSLEKARVVLLNPPIKKTNMILKNPNFQIATKLWAFLQAYDIDDDSNPKDGLDTTGNEFLKGLLDDSFMVSYFVLDSISSLKREQKEKLSKYAIIMIGHQIQRVVSMLLNNGIKISDEEILKIISTEIDSEKSKRLIGSSDVKNKFKSALDEYLERTQDYL